MSYNPNPTTQQGTENKVDNIDKTVVGLLRDVLKELKIMNLHMSDITDLDVSKEDIDA